MPWYGAGGSETPGQDMPVYTKVPGAEGGDEGGVEVLSGPGHLLSHKYLKHNQVRIFQLFPHHFTFIIFLFTASLTMERMSLFSEELI